jgi:hypothetical protein
MTDKWVSIVGFASLLSEKSARASFPDLQNFRKGIVKGYRRIFAHSAPIFFERKIARIETKEYSSCSAEESSNDDLIVSVFEIPESFMPIFYERELEFRYANVHPLNLDGSSMDVTAIMCVKFTDEEYRRERIKSEEDWHQRYGRWGVEKIWDDSLLPCRVYLRHCILASIRFGQDAHKNFMDHSYLADRSTTIRQYMEAHPEIMNELPPEHLQERYNG